MRDGEAVPDRRAQLDPKRRRSRRRRGWIIAALVVGISLAAGGGYVGWALNAPVGAPTVTSEAPPVPRSPAASVALPAEGSSALRISGGEEYFDAAATALPLTAGSAKPRPIASISKLITALVVLDAKPLKSADDPGPTITFSKADHDLYDKYYLLGATIAAMPTGSRMSQHDALATMLIPSASNYAEAVSTWAFGSQGAFVRAAQRWLTAHGLKSTTLVEPTGIDRRNTSTPHDLLELAKLATANPVIAKITSTPSFSAPGPGAMANTNDLLGVDGITGLKTGNLGQDTYNLLYTATLDVGTAHPLSVTGVLLGGFSHESVNADVVDLLDSIRAGFREVPLAARGQEVGSLSTPWGAAARMVVGEDASVLMWSDTPISVTMDTTTPRTYRDGETVGTVTWTAGPNTVTTSVRIEGTIAPPTDWWRLTHPTELG